MAQRIKMLHVSLATVGLLMAIVSGCGDDGGSDDGPDDDGGAAGEDGTAGTGQPRAGSGGRGGNGGTPAAGAPGAAGSVGEEAGSGGDAGAGGGGGAAPTESGIDEVVSAVCSWEFRCCDAGERAYRLSPFVEDAWDCAERLIYEMRESNATANPYSSGPAALGGLLGTLAYTVDLTRVEVNPMRAAECVEAWQERGCTEAPEPDARCTGPGESDPCALTSLFIPKLAVGQECTAALTESALANDVECVAGSTCLDAGDPDNRNDFPTCVKRGLEGDPCTADDDCDFDFYCSSGDCTAKSGVGEPCSFNDPDEPAPNDENAQCKAGLSCHPIELECMEPCTIGFTCAVGSTDADLACPAGSGCAPLEVGESAASFRVCTPLGNSAADLCNSDRDCVESYYCDGTNCQADKPASSACTAHNQCAAGLHCDLSATNTCVTNRAAMTACTAAYQCGPNSAGCLNTGSGGTICRNSLLPRGSNCGSGADCASGRCEVATAAATVATCVDGADEEDECDTLTTDGTAQSCAPGLLCFGQSAMVAGGICVAQAGPGVSCLDSEGEPNNALCANGVACDDTWEDTNLCTDAAVPEANGGTGLVCDGA